MPTRSATRSPARSSTARTASRTRTSAAESAQAAAAGSASERAASITPVAKDGSDRPDYERPEYKSARPARDLCTDLMIGTRAIKAAGEKYLPKWPAEKPKYYAVRAAVSQVARYYERIVKASVGMICSTPPKLSDDAAEEIKSDCEDIDGNGTHLEVFLKDWATDAINGGFSCVLVDHPSVPAGVALRRDQEQALGVRPFWVRITADHIPSWIVEVPDWDALVRDFLGDRLSAEQVQAYARQTLLRQIVIYEPVDTPMGPFGIATVERYRVLRVTDAGVTFAVWEKRQPVAGSSRGLHFTLVTEGIMRGADQVPFREIPLAIVYAGRKTAPFVADPPFLALAELNLDHYQVSADRRYLMKLCHAPTLFLAGFEQRDDGTGQKQGIEVGPNSVITSPDPTAKASYVAASPNALDSSKEEKDDLILQMSVLGMSFLAKDRRGQMETATGRELDDAAENSSHATVARGLQDGAEQALRFHAMYYRGVKAPEITVNTTYASPQIDPQIAGVIFQAVAQDRLPIDVLIEYLRTGQLPAEIETDAVDEIRLVKQQIAAQAKRDALRPPNGPKTGDAAVGDVVDAA